MAIERDIREKTAPFTDYPILFISATNKQRIHKVLELIEQVNNNRNRKISTSELNDVMLEIIKNNPPPALKGKYVKIKFVTQLPIYTPAFAFFCNLPQYVKDPYKRYLENRLREKFELQVCLSGYFSEKNDVIWCGFCSITLITKKPWKK